MAVTIALTMLVWLIVSLFYRRHCIYTGTLQPNVINTTLHELLVQCQSTCECFRCDYLHSELSFWIIISKYKFNYWNEICWSKSSLCLISQLQDLASTGHLQNGLSKIQNPLLILDNLNTSDNNIFHVEGSNKNPIQNEAGPIDSVRGVIVSLCKRHSLFE